MNINKQNYFLLLYYILILYLYFLIICLYIEYILCNIFDIYIYDSFLSNFTFDSRKFFPLLKLKIRENKFYGIRIFKSL